MPPLNDRIQAFISTLDLQPDDRVLEIGCGHGIAAGLICSQLAGGRYTAIDRSPRMIAHAIRRNALHIQTGKAEFIMGAYEQVDLGERRFDKIIAMRVGGIHRRPQEAYALLSRWLKPGGRIHVQYDAPGD